MSTTTADRKATAMNLADAHAGDWIEVDAIGGGPGRRGQILELLGGPGHRHFKVRWDEQHVSLHFPAEGTRVLDAVEAGAARPAQER